MNSTARVDNDAEVEQIPRRPDRESYRLIVAGPRDCSQLDLLSRRPVSRIEVAPSIKPSVTVKQNQRGCSSAVNDSTSCRPPDVYTIAPVRLRGCLVSMQQIDRARGVLGNSRSCGRLLSFVFHYRCQAMAHSAIHLPTLKKTFRQVFSDEWAPELTQDQLSLVLMAIAVSVQFTPRAGPYAYLYSLVHEMGPEYAPNERQIALHDMAKHIVSSRLASPNATLEGLQTIMLFLMYDLDDEPFKDHIFDHAVRSAQRLKFNHVSYEPANVHTGLSSGNNAIVEHEMMVRLWWYFVCRDWLTALTRRAYSLHPNHFTTRLPKVITDEELAEGKSPDSQAAIWSPVSVSIPFIGLASLVRQMVDIRNQKALNSTKSDVDRSFTDIVSDSFDQFVTNVHPLFGLGAEFQEIDSENVVNVRAVQRSETERWILHHQMFHAFLQLHEYRLDEPVPPVMAALAAHILDIQDKIRLRCHIIDSLRINVTGVLRAITVLCIDLMQKHKTSQLSLFRQILLGKIRKALRKTKEATRIVDGDIEKIERLLEMEETAWRAKTKIAVSSGNTNSINRAVALSSTDAPPGNLPGTTFSSPPVLYVPYCPDASLDVSHSLGGQNINSIGGYSTSGSGREGAMSSIGACTASSTTNFTNMSSKRSASSMSGCSPSIEVLPPPPPTTRPSHSSDSGVFEAGKSGAQRSGQTLSSPFGSRILQKGSDFQASGSPNDPYYSSQHSSDPANSHHSHTNSAPGLPLGPGVGGDPGDKTSTPQSQSSVDAFRARDRAHSGSATSGTGFEGPPIGSDMSYLAQWIDLLPTDQAISPIFSSSSHIREPTWEDLYNTFMQQATA